MINVRILQAHKKHFFRINKNIFCKAKIKKFIKKHLEIHNNKHKEFITKL